MSAKCPDELPEHPLLMGDEGDALVDLRLDVQQMIALLPPELQAVARAQMVEDAPAARGQPGPKRGRLRRQKAEIKRLFLQFWGDAPDSRSSRTR